MLLQDSADKTNGGEHEAFAKAADFKMQRHSRDVIRNSEELLESHRRGQVVSGKWSEQESHRLLQDQLDELHEQVPTKTAYEIALREEKKRLQQIIDAGLYLEKQEREYYFDEGLGQSLNEHVRELRSQLPGAEISTRRDADGLPIVKLLAKPKFKYDLDKVLSADPDQLQKTQKETIEAIMKEEGASSDPKAVWDRLTRRTGSEDPVDVNKADLVDQLLEERLYGKYSTDLDGFMVQYRNIKKMKTTSQPKAVSGALAADVFTEEGKRQLADLAVDELRRDQRRLDLELAYQLKMKIQQKTHGEKRELKDFVKPARSENLLYRQQVNSLEDTIHIIEKDNEWLLKAGEADQLNEDARFNVEEY